MIKLGNDESEKTEIKKYKRLGQNYFYEKSSPTFDYFDRDIEKYTPTTEQNSS